MPEIKDQESQNDKINQRLQADNQEEVFPNNLDTMSAGEVAETLTNIVESKKDVPATWDSAKKETNMTLSNSNLTAAKSEPKATRTRKATPAVGKTVDTATVIEDLRKQAQKAHTKIEVIEWIDECVNVQDMPADLEKGPRELLIAYTKEIESVKATYIQKIQSL